MILLALICVLFHNVLPYWFKVKRTLSTYGQKNTLPSARRFFRYGAIWPYNIYEVFWAAGLKTATHTVIPNIQPAIPDRLLLSRACLRLTGQWYYHHLFDPQMYLLKNSVVTLKAISVSSSANSVPPRNITTLNTTTNLFATLSEPYAC